MSLRPPGTVDLPAPPQPDSRRQRLGSAHRRRHHPGQWRFTLRAEQGTPAQHSRQEIGAWVRALPLPAGWAIAGWRRLDDGRVRVWCRRTAPPPPAAPPAPEPWEVFADERAARRSSPRSRAHPPEVRDEARRALQDGQAPGAIAARLKIPASTVRMWASRWGLTRGRA